MKEKLDDLRNIENMDYYYHVTNNNCDNILEDGLYMVEDKIYTTAIPIPDEFWNNPIEYAINEQGMLYRNNANIVIIGIDREIKDELVKPTSMIPDGWELDTPPQYHISSRYIAGYIDVENEDIVLNENFDMINEMSY